MKPVRIERHDAAYPVAVLDRLGAAREPLFLIGNKELLRSNAIAFFCSRKCSGSVILKTYDLAREMRDAGITVIGGFHTPMEKEILAILLRGAQPVIICPARALDKMRLSAPVKAGILGNRVLLLSPFDAGLRRATAASAEQRNRLVSALAAAVFVSHAAPGGKTERLCHEITGTGKPLFTIDCPENENLFALGAIAADAGALAALL